MKKVLPLLLIYSCIILMGACKKFVQVGPPVTSLIKSTVFTSDATATAAMIDIYAMMCRTPYGSPIGETVSSRAALSADELDAYISYEAEVQFTTNQLTALNPSVDYSFWTPFYQMIFRANAIIEGLDASTAITPSLRQRLQGEAAFMRAFAHFYLVNFFGDVPLILSTDYRTNAAAPRTSVQEVYKQIITDLQSAILLLDKDYKAADGTVTTERKRINKYAAMALLSRVYLYTENWLKAEEEASKVISYTDLYKPTGIANMFLKNAPEAIWQLARDNSNTMEATTYAGAPPRFAALTSSFYALFDNNDLRKTNWITIRTSGTNTYYIPTKYKAVEAPPVVEYYTVLRLGEQYLIRAEARAHQPGKLTGANSAGSDLNYIRNRAGVGNTTATDMPAMLQAIEKERAMELFTEWGHRWLDLKRTNRADAVLGPVKGVNWQPTDKLYPIPQPQILNDPAMADKQNPGYN